MPADLLVVAHGSHDGQDVCEVVPGDQVCPHLGEEDFKVMVLDQILFQSQLIAESFINNCLIADTWWPILDSRWIKSVMVLWNENLAQSSDIICQFEAGAD